MIHYTSVDGSTWHESLVNRADLKGAINLANIVFPKPEVVLTAKEKKEMKLAAAESTKRKAAQELKRAEDKAEKERADRRERHARQAEYIEAHS